MSAPEGRAATTPADLRSVDPALRKKYDVRGPRYTSYPPATHFAELDVDQVAELWKQRNGLSDDPGLSLYFHVPFCKGRCLFCACHTYTGGQAKVSAGYVDNLKQEMSLVAEHIDPARPVAQVAFGGGTPNYLSADELNELLDAAWELWSLSPDSERSVEIDPRTATPQKLDAFLQHGFNRFSLGVQDFAPEVIAKVRRGQDSMKVDQAVEYLRGKGCREINFDFIYGLPGQSVATARATARQAVDFGPTRIALYSYAHVPWIYKQQEALGRYGLPDPDTKADIFFAMSEVFAEAGYISIGMDHFALPSDRLARAFLNKSLRRNFMGYTTGRGSDIVAFGVSAIASVGRVYSQDHKKIEDYRQALDRGRLPIERGYVLSDDDLIRRELLTELFCNFTVDLDGLSRQFGIDSGAYFAADFERLAPLRDDGLVSFDEHRIDVSELGRFFIRNVCMCFDRFLEADPGRRMYSKTV